MEYTSAYSFKQLRVWQEAHSFVLEVYRATNSFPNEEKFGLTSQFRRAAFSIPANIAEGYKRLGKAEKLRFFNISQGSLEECRYYIILSHDLGYVDEQAYELLNSKIGSTSYLLNNYCKRISDNKNETDTPF